MTDAGHPQRHGYRRCVRGGHWRRAEGLDAVPGASGELEWRCTSDEVCGRLAGVGEGRLDADTGFDANGSEAK